MKPRPCLVRQITPTHIHLLLIISFHHRDPSNPDVLGSLSRKFLLKRLVPISSIPASTDVKQILVKSSPGCVKPIVDSYLILQPTCVLISTQYTGSSVGSIEQGDLLFIERQLDIVNVVTDDENDDASVDTDTSSSTPISRSFPCPNSNEKVKNWLRKSKQNRLLNQIHVIDF